MWLRIWNWGYWETNLRFHLQLQYTYGLFHTYFTSKGLHLGYFFRKRKILSERKFLEIFLEYVTNLPKSMFFMASSTDLHVFSSPQWPNGFHLPVSSDSKRMLHVGTYWGSGHSQMGGGGQCVTVRVLTEHHVIFATLYRLFAQKRLAKGGSLSPYDPTLLLPRGCYSSSLFISFSFWVFFMWWS